MSKPIVYTKYAMPWIGKSIIVSSGPLWKKLRKLDVPCFSHKNMQNSLYYINHHSSIYIKTLESYLEKDTIDLNIITEKFILSIFCSVVMQYSNDEKGLSDLFWCTSTMVDIMLKRLWSALYQFDWIFRFSRHYKLQQKSSKLFKKILNDALQSRRKLILDENFNEKSFALIDNLILAAKHDESITDEIICGELGTFMVAGVDTLSAVVKFALFALSKNLNIQNKAVEELKQIFEDDPARNVTMNDVQSMKYLAMVVKETMRKYTPIPLVARSLSENVEHGNYI